MKENWERNKPIIEPSLESLQAILHNYDPNLHIEKITLLTGGLSHSNYKVELTDHSSLVARFTTNKKTLTLEQNLHRILPEQVRAPDFLHLSHQPEYSCAFIEWKEGDQLKNRLSSSSKEMYAIGRSVGNQLASLRKVSFESQGFLDTDLNVKNPFQLTPDSFVSTIESFTLKEPLTKRIPRELSEQILKHSKKYSELFLEDESKAHLVHGDFNGLNLLIQETEVSAVLDWEFAFSGSIYLDIGNMIRYDHFPNMDDFEEGLLQELRNNRILLSSNWRILAKLADLVALCSLLDSPYGGSNRFKDIKRLISKTVVT